MQTKTNKKSIIRSSILLAIVFCIGATMLPGLISPTYAANTDTIESVNLIDLDTNWRYLDDNTDPANGDVSKQTEWTTPGYDDSSWKQDKGKFGALRGVIGQLSGGYTPTVLLTQYMSGTTTNIPTFFFRTKIQVTDVENITSITGTIKADDGVVVYLNGHKIAEDNMTKVDVVAEPNMYYAGNGNGAPADKSVNINKDDLAGKLVEGENTIAVELHNDRASSSDLYMEFTNLQANIGEVEVPLTQKAISLHIGADASQRNITWYANTNTAGTVQVAKKNGNTFPATYETYPASVSSEYTNDTIFYSHQATMSQLEANTEYVYRLVNGDLVSEMYSFTTGNMDGSFNFILAGDPQIGSGDAGVAQNAADWADTLAKSYTNFTPDFLVSAGDQVETAGNETHYTGYLENSILKSLPTATVIGNHDSRSNAYQEHFNLPNESTDKGLTTAGGDYYYVYNNTLFMGINTNNRSTAEHKAFMEEVIALHPDVRWKTVVFHHSIYSTASHVDDTDIIERRQELTPVLDELDIDVVLMGHDHVYTRSYMMNGFEPDITDTVQNTVTDPTGILYLTANSASGSKYYDFHTTYDVSFAAVKSQSYTRTITNIEVTDNAYTMTTYYVDDMSVLDTFTINKTPVTGDNTELQAKVTEFEGLVAADYTTDSWQTFASAMEEAKAVLADDTASQEVIDATLTKLTNAKETLVVVETPSVIDKTKLQAKITEFEGLVASKYTSGSWQTFASAMKEAKAVLADDTASQEVINAALTKLMNAKEALVKVTAVPTKDTDNSTVTKNPSRPSSTIKTRDSTDITMMGVTFLTAALGLVAVGIKKEKQDKMAK